MLRSVTRVGIVTLFLVAAACGGTTPPRETTPVDPGACSEAECGPPPGAGAGLCDDGVSISGPTGSCVRDASGTCHYEMRACPAPVARSCGGMVPNQTPCRENEFCDYALDAMCGAADAPGTCRVRPEACTMDYAPVCGCDDHTYPNACGAAAAGVAVGATGECPVRAGSAGDTCGTRGVPPCGDGLFCDFPAASICGRADGPGTCAAKPETCDARVRRVCGCDGTTYTNACAANLAGVSVERTGACRTH